MKWQKLEYGKWPKGTRVMRIDLEGAPEYEVGFIKISKTNQEVYFDCMRPMQLYKINIDSIYDLDPYYISLDDVEMPE